jgi:hypothetical protein
MVRSEKTDGARTAQEDPLLVQGMMGEDWSTGVLE